MPGRRLRAVPLDPGADRRLARDAPPREPAPRPLRLRPRLRRALPPPPVGRRVAGGRRRLRPPRRAGRRARVRRRRRDPRRRRGVRPAAARRRVRERRRRALDRQAPAAHRRSRLGEDDPGHGGRARRGPGRPCPRRDGDHRRAAAGADPRGRRPRQVGDRRRTRPRRPRRGARRALLVPGRYPGRDRGRR